MQADNFFGKLSVSLVEVTFSTLSHFREGYFICMTFFLVSPINHTIDYAAIMCNYAPLSSCKI